MVGVLRSTAVLTAKVFRGDVVNMEVSGEKVLWEIVEASADLAETGEIKEKAREILKIRARMAFLNFNRGRFIKIFI